MAFSIDADLTSVFSWNTKLLFVYLAAEYATPLNALSQARLRSGDRAPFPALNRRAQVSLFDRIIESKEDAHVTLPFVRNKYKLLDQVPLSLLRRMGAVLRPYRALQGRNLRGLSVNLTLYWNVMPVVGRLSTGAHTFPPVRLPSECVAAFAAASGYTTHSPPQIRAATRRGGVANGQRRRSGRPSTPPGSKPSRLKRDMPSAPAMAWPYA